MDRTLEFPAQQPMVEVYTRYLPELIIEKIISADPGESEAIAEQFFCAVIFADISGFTRLQDSWPPRARMAPRN